jgi:hypothetical protein
MLIDEDRHHLVGEQSTQNGEAIEEVRAAALVELDDATHWYRHPSTNVRLILTESREDPSLGDIGSCDAAQHDDDDVLDQWLASLTLEEFVCFFDGLANGEDGPCLTLDPAS